MSLASLRRFFFGATWSNDRVFDPEWEKRTAAMADLIPAGSSVIEFGASRSKLRKYLPDDCDYLATDIHPTKDCIFLDLNTVDLRTPERTFDVAFLAGVLEYVDDVPRVAQYLKGISQSVITSYVATDFVPGRLRRRSMGWRNHYSKIDIENIFFNARLTPDRRHRLWRATALQVQEGSPVLVKQ